MRALLLVLPLLAGAAPAGAIECPSIAGGAPSLAAIDPEARLRFLQAGMHHAARNARVWAWSSAAVLLAVGNFQIVAASYAPDRGDRIDLWVGAASLSLGLFQIAAFPPLVMFDQPRVDRLVRRAAAGPESERCAQVAEAERLLARDAASEAFGRSPFMHGITSAFSIAVGLVLGIGFDRWTSAAINIFLGLALGELQILTEPQDSVSLLARYRAGDLKPRRAEAAPRWRITPRLGREQAGLSLSIDL